jgi:hypothetical protein
VRQHFGVDALENLPKLPQFIKADTPDGLKEGKSFD